MTAQDDTSPPNGESKIRHLGAQLGAQHEEVLRHVARGLGNKEIAQAIGRSAETVKSHLEGIFQKLGAKDRTHAVTIALQRGIIHLDE